LPFQPVFPGLASNLFKTCDKFDFNHCQLYQ
jgi:hypothetical protein